MTLARPALCLAVVAAAAGCGGRPPTSPATAPSTSTPGTTITGNERIAWTQSGEAADGFVYAIYVDTVRIELADASCTSSAAQVFDCQSPLAPMTKGTHTLELTAAVADGDTLLEGPKSAPIVVTVAGS